METKNLVLTPEQVQAIWDLLSVFENAHFKEFGGFEHHLKNYSWTVEEYNALNDFLDDYLSSQPSELHGNLLNDCCYRVHTWPMKS